MIQVTNIEVFNFPSAIRGMRNPMNSWDKSDSDWCICDEDLDCGDCPLNPCLDAPGYVLGENDLRLAKLLANSTPDDGKFLRQISVCMDINAPFYFWKEMDQYKVGTTTNSCSTMHKLTHKPFEVSDFSTDHINEWYMGLFTNYVNEIEKLRETYLESEPRDKDMWYTMIQMLPSSYNQMRTWTANYAVLKNIYRARKNHKLDEWREFCAMIETLPYAKELICGEDNNDK